MLKSYFSGFIRTFLRQTLPEKCYLIINNSVMMGINVRSEKTSSKSSEKLLRIYITAKISFDNHSKILCCKASHKLNALSRAEH